MKRVGVVAPGLSDWDRARRILTGIAPYVAAPIPSLPPADLPSNERRRATLGTRIALEAARQATAGLTSDPSELIGVFAASEADLTIIDLLCTDLFKHKTPVSPTVFHNSVHNSVAGYWSIAHGCRQASISLSAWDGSLAAGLIECAAQLACSERPVLLVAYDLPGPALIDPHRHIEGPFACALALFPNPSADCVACLEVEPSLHGAEDRLPAGLDRRLETLRAGNPAARVLPLLCRIAAGDPGSVRLPYLSGLDLVVRVG